MRMMISDFGRLVTGDKANIRLLAVLSHSVRFSEDSKLSIGVNVSVNGCWSICAMFLAGDQSRMHLISHQK